MAGIDDIIGGWVRDAEKSGEVEKLPGYGKPLDLESDKHIPPKYRMAYRVLKNAGYAPPEVEMIRRIAELRSLLESQQDEATRTAMQAEIAAAQQKLDVALEKFRSRS